MDERDGDDNAGRMIGWSIGAGMARRPLDELVQFPCSFCFKAVGSADDDFVAAMLARVGAVLGRAVGDDERSLRDSASGRYVCVTLQLWVTSSDQVYDVYEAMKADARVKYLL